MVLPTTASVIVPASAFLFPEWVEGRSAGIEKLYPGVILGKEAVRVLI